MLFRLSFGLGILLLLSFALVVVWCCLVCFLFVVDGFVVGNFDVLGLMLIVGVCCFV